MSIVPRSIACLLALSVLVAWAVAAGAVTSDSGFGLGIITGEPSGLSGKYWLGGEVALDMALAWSFEGDDALLLQADYVHHQFGVLDVSAGKLPLYFGLGGWIKFSDNTNVGLRIPVGLDYLFENAPLDLFLELVPSLRLNNSTDFDLNGGLGIRYFFR